ncbi:esterase, PHB depolymerase family [Reichenbachiella faecimaris]|uniref:Esterase, PHB depolymerase family n=1 Tax=Reichenbachiella faecimaris TaxID=692418 RepID=A0A1W2GD83_REIFA|nr:PHB depolymerase family esterase [Reichenbachiella faecimaris]SMD34629.1 esterase, PHB depolymerase family [Reichenbachiella faecimaris]
MKKLLNLLFFCLMMSTAHGQLTSIPNFGSNPGNLSMYIHTPGNMPSDAPLVLVMHGCTQTASSYSNESDWNSLADTYKFYVIHAQQKSANNSSECFNWFETGDISRGYGEAASLKNMTDYMKNNYSIDNGRVFATGFSGGGAMTTVMLATYPDIFSGGAVMSGLPYKVATSTNAAFMAMFGNVNQSPSQLGNSVRSASSHNGPWPKVVSFHGSSDYTVYYMNQNEIMEQWTNVHGIDQTVDVTENSFMGNSAITKSQFQDANGNTQVVTYSINGMGHTIAIDPGNGETQGGHTGSYTNDVDFFSSYWAAEFFGILENTTPSLNPPTNVSATASSSTQINLSWIDNASTETAYHVERALSSGGNYSTIATLSANASSYNDESLAPATTYYYKITVTDGSTSASSIEVSATTQQGGTNSPPAAPSSLSASATGMSSVQLSWQDNANNENAHILERSEGNESNYAVIANLSANVESYSDNGLSASTTYYYRVKASNAEGNSAYSNSANATTEGQATIVTIGSTSGNGILSYSNSNAMGQSFTATADGQVVEIDVKLVYGISGSSLKIFQGNTVSGSPAYEQTGISAASGWQTIPLSTPFDVSYGQVYTFVITNSSIRYAYSNTYNSGNFWYNTISYGVFDAAFTISVSTSSGSARFAESPDNIAHLGKPFTIYPNPSFGTIKVRIGEEATLGRLELITTSGQVLMRKDLNANLSEVNLEGIKSGLYILQIKTQDQLFKSQLVVR